MPQYTLKVLLEFEGRDDIEARQHAAKLVQEKFGAVSGVRDIVLHSQLDHKSIKLNPDGTFQGQWNKGGGR